MLKLKKVSKYSVLLFIALGLVIVAGCSDDDSDQTGNGGEQMKREDVADVFLDGDYARVYHQTSKEFQKEVSVKELQDIGEVFNEGVDTYLFQSELQLDEKTTQYVWKDEDNSKGVVAVFDEQDTIVGFRVMPLETYPNTDDLFTETTFNLPFENEWFVVWGGMNQLVNYHYVYENQRYAFDFLIRKDSSTYDGDPAKNESYYAFGENMLAPADGTIVEVENDIEDNEPVGEMNEEKPLGNYVIIDHGNDEFSFLAHFKQGSIKVKEGDQVKANDVLGLVGNSGNSSEPHIHFHVANSTDKNDSKSIRIDLKGNKDLIQGEFVTPES